MSVINRLKAIFQATVRGQPQGGLAVHRMGRSTAGIAIWGEEDALSFTPVWACVRVIAETLASLPWHVFARGSNGRRTQLDRHALNRILNIAPNDEMTSFGFRERMAAWALLWGDAYAEIQRDLAGRVTALWPIEPHRVKAARNDAGRLTYVVHNPGAEDTELDYLDMYHVRGLGPTGLSGYYVVALFREAIALGLASQTQAASFFGNAGMPCGFLRYPGILSNEKALELLENFEGRHGGPFNRGRVGLLKGGLEFQSVGVTNEDAELEKTRVFQALEACRIFRVPPHKIAELSRATYSNIAEQETAFGRDTITPWALRFSQEADAKLFPDNQAGQFYTQINVNAIMRGDPKGRAEVYKLMQEMGVYSINDILALEDRNTIGPEGDKRIILSNYTTLEKIGADPEPIRVEAPAAEPAGDDSGPESAEPTNGSPRPGRPIVAQAMRGLFLDLNNWLVRRSRQSLAKALEQHCGPDLRPSKTFHDWLEGYIQDSQSLITGRLWPLTRAFCELNDLPTSLSADAANELGYTIACALAEPWRSGERLPTAADGLPGSWPVTMSAWIVSKLDELKVEQCQKS